MSNAPEQLAIFAPFFGMLVLTFVVWLFMYVRRLRFLSANNIDPQQLTTPDKGVGIIPEAISYPAHNLRNLLELPVVFYALCLYLFTTGQVDRVDLVLGWVFLGFRCVHSAIHCTANIVKLRFASHMAASLALWSMLGLAIFERIST